MLVTVSFTNEHFVNTACHVIVCGVTFACLIFLLPKILQNSKELRYWQKQALQPFSVWTNRQVVPQYLYVCVYGQYVLVLS